MASGAPVLTQPRLPGLDCRQASISFDMSVFHPGRGAQDNKPAMAMLACLQCSSVHAQVLYT